MQENKEKYFFARLAQTESRASNVFECYAKVSPRLDIVKVCGYLSLTSLPEKYMQHLL